jgi:hypothetical protein
MDCWSYVEAIAAGDWPKGLFVFGMDSKKQLREATASEGWLG